MVCASSILKFHTHRDMRCSVVGQRKGRPVLHRMFWYGFADWQSLTGEEMSWWSEDSAWPGVIDQFVEYVKEKREGQMEG